MGQEITQRLNQQRAEGGATFSASRPSSDSDRYSWDYEKPTAQRLEPVTLKPPLWILRKDWHEASAHVRSIDGVGLELRFMIDGELRHSQLFRDWRLLENAAKEKKIDFESRGWRIVRDDVRDLVVTPA